MDEVREPTSAFGVLLRLASANEQVGHIVCLQQAVHFRCRGLQAGEHSCSGLLARRGEHVRIRHGCVGGHGLAGGGHEDPHGEFVITEHHGFPRKLVPHEIAHVRCTGVRHSHHALLPSVHQVRSIGVCRISNGCLDKDHGSEGTGGPDRDVANLMRTFQVLPSAFHGKDHDMGEPNGKCCFQIEIEMEGRHRCGQLNAIVYPQCNGHVSETSKEHGEQEP